MVANVQSDEKIILQLFDIQPDSVVWFVPIFSQDTVNGKIAIDFEVKYCNVAACKILGAQQGQIIGSALSNSPLIDNTSRKIILEQCLQVWNTGDLIDFTYYSPGFEKHFNVQRSKIMNGVLSITRDRTSEVQAEMEREKQSLLLNKIINNSPACIVLCKALRDQTGKITDFDLLMVNEKIAKDLNRSKEEIQSMTYCTLHPAIRTNGLIDILAHVVESGNAFRDELYLEVFGGWFHLSAEKVDDNKVLATYLNINETKNYTQTIEHQAQWYNSVLKYSTNGIIALESIRDNKNEIIDFEIKLCNPSGLKMGNLPNDAVGKNICDVLPQFKTTGYIELHKNVVENGEPYINLLPFNNGAKDGWFQISLSKLDDGLVSNFMDVTELKGHEKTIQYQAELLDLILNASLNGLYMLNAIRNTKDEITDFEITHVNDAFCKMSQKTQEEIVGKSYLKTYPHTKSSGVFDRNCEVLKTGKKLRYELHYNGDGVDSWFDTSVCKVSEDRIVIAFNDISALKNSAVQLETSNEELKKSNARLSDFTHVASHDLNEPLRKIKTFAQLLTERHGDKLEAGANDYLAKINKTASRMQALINDLLTYSQVSNTIKEFENVSLNTVIQEVLNDLEASVNQKQAKITFTELPLIKGDKTQLRQIFQNLISNAIKFQKQGAAPNVIIRDGGEVKNKEKYFSLISVEDNGIGFEQSHAQKIFQLFQRLHSKNEYDGTGIGLAIVQRALENHNGFIEVESEPGKGSCFKLFFPINK